ncbi:MAG TPA: hypothetical protein ENJ08_14800 [Gammaproteobacteria bacterium]|nr:hypothetical protein [Gammaproteobacteria bacterium]
MIFMKYTRQISTVIFCYLIAGSFSSATAYDFSAGVFEFQQKMAKKGDAQAQYKLAFMYENGQGTEKDLNKATGWYKKAAKKRFPAAKMRLTYIDTLKNGFKPEKHGPWLAKLKQDAGANDGESLFLLASMHRDGYIVKKDLKRSSSLFKRAIKKDVPGAEAEYEAVQAILFSQQDRQQKTRANTEKANSEKARTEKARTEKARAEKARAEKEKTSQQQAAERQKAEQQRQQKLAAQRAKRDREREMRQRQERERALQEQRARKAEEQRIAQEKKEAEEARKKAEEEKPLVDKSMCKGKKAKFLTTCR